MANQNRMPQTERIIGYREDGRPVVLNEDGSHSTERTVTVGHPGINQGAPTNIPTMYEGRQVDPRQAIARMLMTGGIDPETGQRPQGYAGFPMAEAAAQQRSKNMSVAEMPYNEQEVQRRRGIAGQDIPPWALRALMGNQ